MLLNYMVNGHWHPVFLTPTNTGYLDVLLGRDMLLTTPLKMEDQHICLVSILGYPLETYPGMLQQLALLPYDIEDRKSVV